MTQPSTQCVEASSFSSPIAGRYRDRLPPGDPVLVYLAAANRDPSIFTNPDELRPGREGPPPLSFAHGAHYCLGASLATAELEVMLRTVARTWPSLRRTSMPITWHQRRPFRGLDRLDVTLR